LKGPIWLNVDVPHPGKSLELGSIP
jgi:hypothetical protein